MTKQTRMFSGLALCAALAAGCDATQFAAINTSYGQMKGASNTFGSAAVPAAAIAAASGGLELVKALSAESSSKIIAAGAGNAISTNNGASGIIAAGGLNYVLAQAGDITKDIKATNLDAVATYTSTEETDTDGGKVIVSQIKSFKGTSQGYTINVTGTFRYKSPKAAAYQIFQAGSVGQVEASMQGSVTYRDTEISLDELKFATLDPLPETAENIGSFKMTSKDGNENVVIEAKLAVDKKKITVSGTSKVGSNSPRAINFDEDNAGGLGDATEAQ